MTIPEQETTAAAFGHSLAYFVPVAATWAFVDPTTAEIISITFPLAVAGWGIISKRGAAVRHGFQAFHIVTFLFLVCVAAGLLEHPGDARWIGGFGSIPIDANSSMFARAAFWIIALGRAGLLLFLGLRAAAGRPLLIPVVADPPLKFQIS